MNIKRTLSALAAAGLCAVAPAKAQPLDPQTEFRCIHGMPVAADVAEADLRRIKKAMDLYLALSPSSTPATIKDAFTSYIPGARWRDGDQEVPLDQLAPHLVGPVETPRLVTAVFGGDNITSRTVWAGRDANGPVFYEVLFTNGAFLQSAAILDMKISHGPTPPDTPPAYCHFGTPYTGNLDDN